MLVYGDHDRDVDTRAFVAEIERRAARLAREPAGLAWHGACVALFIDIAGLLQGVTDAESARVGADEVSATQDAIMAALVAVAAAIDRSWVSRFRRRDLADLNLPAMFDAPATLTIRRCEGYAYYALYPELYLAAARALPAGCLVVGLRSIGAGLAALVASVCGGRALTVRPVGPPFSRTIAAGSELTASALRHADGPVVLVDEGPGLSGSSFGGAADWLESLGVARGRILFMPGHGGDLGPHASAPHRERWNVGRKLVASFDAVIARGDDGTPLADWFRDLTGDASAMEDVSGGAWRARSPRPDAPVDPGREARKFLLTGANGRFLLKFVGLDAGGSAKFERARRLHAAEFSPEPLAYRYGFLLEAWCDADAAEVGEAELVAWVTRYLRFRAAAFADAPAGAPLGRLLEMARYNLGRLTDAAEPLIAAWTHDRVDALERRVRPVHVDGRMHRWEWLRTPGGLLKTDAVDHSEAHDLVGCQDIAWDVAGAVVEFDLSDAARDALTVDVVGSDRSAANLVECCTLCYLGFQAGWWTFAPVEARAQRDGYVAKVERLAARRA